MTNLLKLAFALVVFSTWTGLGATLTSPSANYTDVAAKVAQAVDGDTVLVPAGTATWSQSINITTKGISVIAAGTNATVINNSSGALFRLSNQGANFVRISGFRFNNADGQTPIIQITGPVLKFRVDNCWSIRGDVFVGPNLYGAGNGPVYGVIDHCRFENMVRPLFASDWRNGDGSNTAGRQAWNEWNPSGGATFVGTDKAIYMEDCVGNWTAGTPANSQGMLYGGFGGKAVLRFSTMTGMQPYIDAHGDSPDYGTILYELYGNDFTEGSAAGFQGVQAWQRGGTWLAYSNKFRGTILPMKGSVYWETDIHRVTNTFTFDNQWISGGSTNTNPASIYQIGDSGQTSPGYSAAHLKLGTNYFYARPSASNGKPAGIYASYAPYTYPHPLISGGSTVPTVPSTPVNSTPANGTANLTLTPTLTLSAYSSTAAQSGAQIQVLSNSVVIWDSGTLGATNSATVAVNKLVPNTVYSWKGRYLNSVGWSAYSAETSFATAALPAVPTNVSPANAAVNVSLTPTLTLSPYSSDALPQTAAQFAVYQGGPSSIWNSGELGVVNSAQVPSGVLSNGTAYSWIGRYKNANGWSGVSAATTFTTTNTLPSGTIQWEFSSYSTPEAGPTIALRATRTGGSSGPISASWATANGTATAGHDYAAGSGTVTFGDGVTTAQTVTITIINSGDTATTNRTFTVTLSGSPLGTPTVATVTIIMNPPAPAGGIGWTNAVFSTAHNAGSVNLAAYRFGGSSGAVGATYTTGNGTALAGRDFTAASSAVSFANGVTNAVNVPITILNSGQTSAVPRYFFVTLSSPTGGASLSGVSTAMVVISMPAPPQTPTVLIIQNPSSVILQGGVIVTNR